MHFLRCLLKMYPEEPVAVQPTLGHRVVPGSMDGATRFMSARFQAFRASHDVPAPRAEAWLAGGGPPPFMFTESQPTWSFQLDVLQPVHRRKRVNGCP